MINISSLLGQFNEICGPVYMRSGVQRSAARLSSRSSSSTGIELFASPQLRNTDEHQIQNAGWETNQQSAAQLIFKIDISDIFLYRFYITCPIFLIDGTRKEGRNSTYDFFQLPFASDSDFKPWHRIEVFCSYQIIKR